MVEKTGQNNPFIFKQCPLTWLIACKAIIMATSNVLQTLCWHLAQSEVTQLEPLSQPFVNWKIDQRFAYILFPALSHISCQIFKSFIRVNGGKLDLERTEGMKMFENDHYSPFSLKGCSIIEL
jgi:hypothetical protein